MRYFFVTSNSNSIRHPLRLCRLFRHHSLIRLFFLCSILIVSACNSTKYAIGKVYKKMNTVEKQLADTLMLKALDNEAIYTLLDTLKPMSSVQFYKLPLLSTDNKQKDSAYTILTNIQNVANKMSASKWQFVVQPFERNDSIYKNVEIYVFRKTTLQKVITNQQAFYQSLGIVPNTNPATVLAITEYEQKYNRWRSYGYLFGYPSYAVDFFVEAGKSQDSTKVFVKRDFFAIPVYAGETGHFTYAVPKGYQTNAVDSAIYNNAMPTLKKYKLYRKRYTINNKTKAFKIFQKLN